ncbi:MAG: chromosome segregation protein SMC [Clostridia bacterium]|nr:chromosome segregation protein SMC [Clostridia bacterium]
MLEIITLSLKKIELQGFKSFANKTVINFDKAFNCIVGPNGCGKSNVADAIRWVLGEQSAKTLRGNKMNDVIFSGTARLPQMSYAEVSLFFDNTDGTFKTAYDEVIITRKLFRSGVSEYYLNHSIRRLRDIVDLMRDTGAGREGYSIIGQGKVSEIMNAKPIERRRIFEEAAGIARTKAEKLETERKLEGTKIDIQRVADILSEIDSRLIPLAKQVEAAKKYEAYKEQLKYQELNLFLYQTQNAEIQRAQRTARIKELSEVIRDREAELLVIASKNCDYAAENEELEKKIRANLEEKEQLKVATEKASWQITVYKAKYDALKSDNSRLEKEKGLLNEEITAFEEEVNEARKILDIKINEKINSEIRLNGLEAQYDALLRDIAGTESCMQQSNNAVLNEMDRLTDVKSEYARAVTEEEALKQRKEKLTEEIANVCALITREEGSIQDAKRSLDSIERKKSDIKLRRNTYATQFNENQYKLRELNGQINTLGTAIGKKEERIASLTSITSQYYNYQDAVRGVMTDAASDIELSSHIIGVVGQLIKVPQKYELAIEMVLGGAIQNIVTHNEDGAKSIITYVQKKQYGRVTCLPSNKINAQKLAYEYTGALNNNGVFGVASELISYEDKHSNIIQNLLGRTVIVEDIDIAKTLANRYDYGFKIVTLDGTIFDPRRTITGGSSNRKNSMYLGHERELSEARADIAALRELYANTEKLIQERENRAKAYQDSMNSDKDELHGLDVAFATETQRAEQSAARAEEARGDLTRFEREKAAISLRIDALTSIIKTVESSTSDIEVKKKSANEQLEVSKSETEDKKKAKDSINDKITQLKIVISNLGVELNKIEGDIKRLNDAIVQKSRALEGCEIQLKQLDEDMKSHASNAPKLEYSENDSMRIADIEVIVKGFDSRREEIKNKQCELEKSRDHITTTIKLMSENRTREEGHLERIDNDLNAFAERIRCDYELEYEEVKAYRDENFDNKKSAGEIASLKGRIAQLGAINFNAVEDYETESIRRAEYGKQVDDLTKAQKDLEELLKRITSDMAERFEKGFEQISQNFKKTFADLFGGGKAELVLEENAEDEFERGVDIRVQLPGKSMRPLSALSGGEQALTSIAILFAILKLKPMPFAVLDEVESALDDSNARRFALYLKKYSKTTKFIVISHKKPSMEQADVLFGVTMEEPGLSKVITAAFEDAVKIAEAK